MLPKPPPRRPQLGFLYFPPFRVQGLSVAGEASVVHIPELDLAFDLGACPKAVLPATIVAVTHGHMDHIAAAAYYFSQRHFQDMSPGHVVCPTRLEAPLKGLMKAWVEVEHQQTPHTITGLPVDAEMPLKGNLRLRAFETNHRVPSQGYLVMEHRSKLKEEYVGLPQEALVKIKAEGKDITRTLEIPLIAYTGDTAPGDHFDREDVRNAKLLITECTFIDPGHRDRAKVGRHMHLDDIIDLLEKTKAEAVVLTHLSRRTHLGQARKTLDRYLPSRHRDRVHLLMDGRSNTARYDEQVAQAEVAAAEQD